VELNFGPVHADQPEMAIARHRPAALVRLGTRANREFNRIVGVEMRHYAFAEGAAALAWLRS
jgi:hypothetical protein